MPQPRTEVLGKVGIGGCARHAIKKTHRSTSLFITGNLHGGLEERGSRGRLLLCSLVTHTCLEKGQGVHVGAQLDMTSTQDAASSDHPEVSEAQRTCTVSAERGHPRPSDGVSPLPFSRTPAGQCRLPRVSHLHCQCALTFPTGSASPLYKTGKQNSLG